MGVLDLFHKRGKAARNAGQPDVYQDDELPQEFRNQEAHIWNTAISGDGYIFESGLSFEGYGLLGPRSL